MKAARTPFRYTLTQFAKRIGVSRELARRLIVDGPVPGRSEGGRLVVLDSDLEAAIASGGAS